MSLIKYVDRKNTDCLKWDGLRHSFSCDDLLAMWVADMDFRIPDCVIRRLSDYVEQGTFGYYRPPEGYYDAFINWEKRYHGYEVKREWLRFAPGVVPAFNWMVQILTEAGDAVAVMTPVYYPFMAAVRNNGRQLVECPLLQTERGFEMDHDGFEEAIERENVRAFIFCSPHNPVGRVWKKEEIRRMLDICSRHGVYIISDEIHHDLIMSGHKHVPAATTGAYDDILVTLTAATKTFNLASVQNSIAIIPDRSLRAKWDRFTEGIRISSGNAFGYIAVQAAYEEGRPWLEELLEVIEGNYKHLRSRLEAELPEVRIADLEGTYLMWIDLSAYIDPTIASTHDTKEKAIKYLMEDKCGIAVDYGAWFGGDHAGCIRVNLATSRENIGSAADRIITALK